MKAINFHYWLQGCFELGLISTLDEKQLNILKHHISLVKDKSEFIIWLEGFLVKKGSLNEELCLILAEKLSKEFNKVPMENPFPSDLFDLKRTFDTGQQKPFDIRDRMVLTC